MLKTMMKMMKFQENSDRKSTVDEIIFLVIFTKLICLSFIKKLLLMKTLI